MELSGFKSPMAVSRQPLRTGIRDGEQAFVLYRADGTPLVVVDDVETAVEMAATHGLGIVTIH
jgi:hypothetical protein